MNEPDFLHQNKYSLDISKIFDVIRKAGKICLESQKNLSSLKFEYKQSKKDIVTETDKKIEIFLINSIKEIYPDHSFFGEETANKYSNDSNYTWIIDPIDGTNSFFHNQYHFSISLALKYKNEIIFGAVYAPKLEQLFYALKGEGAYCNHNSIKVSKIKDPMQALIATGFAALRHKDDEKVLAQFCNVIKKVQGIRRYGSAALDLCYTAEGSVDGFWESELNIYDIAAGVLIVLEAGGKVTDYKGDSDFVDKRQVLASNGLLHEILISLLK